jgi:hypothetical protein
MSGRSRVRTLAVALAGALGLAAGVVAAPEPARRSALSDAITEIDLERARRLLDAASGDATVLALERARLAIYLGQCDAAAAELSVPTLAESPAGADLSALAGSCARATAAGFVIEDRERGIWVRLQDDADRTLAPFIMDTAVKARDVLGAELGIDFPRPLRIDVVRDLFSLSAVSGLPLEAAETTGTLAVARWGRVIMLSPRATDLGYPWQDTLAHEITHLLVTRATTDHAPLWLQEGIAKREESRWRAARPFDDPSWAEQTARSALLAGRSVQLPSVWIGRSPFRAIPHRGACQPPGLPTNASCTPASPFRPRRAWPLPASCASSRAPRGTGWCRADDAAPRPSRAAPRRRPRTGTAAWRHCWSARTRWS